MPALSREKIYDQLVELVSAAHVSNDLAVLQENSMDRYRKLQSIHGEYPCPLPAAVVRPQSVAQVADVLRFLNKQQINCIPRTGGTATEGGLEAVVEDSVVIDGSALNKIIDINKTDMIATVQCGVNLGDLETELRKQGLTTGHSPQSKPLAQMGGLVATRSIGQFSTLYGGIEDMVIGLEAVFPDGEITKIKNVPRRAAGPDIRHVVIGNEGALCYITEVSVKLFTYFPDNNRYLGYTVSDMKAGFEVLREVMVQGYRPSVARLYDVEDGMQHGFDSFAGKNCLLIFVAEGPKPIADATANAIAAICESRPETKAVESRAIADWFEHLNWGPEKIEQERETIRKTGRIGFTTEVSGNWSIVHQMYENCIRRIREDFEFADDLLMLGCHSSHSYQTGTNLYFVYDYDISRCKPSEEITKYHIPLNAMIVEETLKLGGSMAHHHGVGKYRSPWIQEEHGSAYYILQKLKDSFDPNGIMNAGTIFPLSKM